MNSINKVQEMRVQTKALLGGDLGLKISDSLLILLVSTVTGCVQSGAIVGRQGRTYALLRPRDGEVFQRRANPEKRSIFKPRAPSAAKLCRVYGHAKSRAMDLRRPIAESCFAPAKRDMAVTKGEWLEDAGTVH
jgi:hypothetical protein